MKLNQSLNSNYGNSINEAQIIIKKSKAKKKSGGPAAAPGYSKTPFDFESSMSSNSALLMMDGGTGSERIQGLPSQQNGANQFTNKNMMLRQSLQQPGLQ